MKGRNITLIIILAIVLLLGGCGCSGYNRLVGKDVEVKKAWSNVETEYQRRADLVPNLVSTVKGAANFEQETLTRVIEARAKATSVNVSPENLTTENIQRYEQAQTQLSGALSRLLVTVERYPELKANQNFLQLQGQLEQIENGVGTARRQFNTVVADYNVQVRTFPNNIFAGMFGFSPREGFKADPGSQNAPKVQF